MEICPPLAAELHVQQRNVEQKCCREPEGRNTRCRPSQIRPVEGFLSSPFSRSMIVRLSELHLVDVRHSPPSAKRLPAVVPLPWMREKPTDPQSGAVRWFDLRGHRCTE